jgi:hypothetical protein
MVPQRVIVIIIIFIIIIIIDGKKCVVVACSVGNYHRSVPRTAAITVPRYTKSPVILNASLGNT